MRENETNAQDLLKEEMVMKPEDNQTNFMEDFLKVASEESKIASNIDLNETKLESQTTENMINENQSETSLKVDSDNIGQESFHKMEQTELVKTEINSGMILEQVREPIFSQDSNFVSEPTEVGQVSKENIEIRVQKKNHWKFILTLFGIVAIFVLLLPLFIKWFGY